jgi:hypothetical protein
MIALSFTEQLGTMPTSWCDGYDPKRNEDDETRDSTSHGNPDDQPLRSGGLAQER